jgi:hypothetical protein
MESKKIKSEHHRGEEVPIWVALSDHASQEACDDEVYDLMQEASEYIKELEDKVTELETKLSPFKEMAKGFLGLIDELEHMRKVPEPVLVPVKKIHFTGGSHSLEAPISFGPTKICSICGCDGFEDCQMTKTYICGYCGQKYNWR